MGSKQSGGKDVKDNHRYTLYHLTFSVSILSDLSKYL